MKRFYNPSDIDQYIVQSFILYKSEPAWCASRVSDSKVHLLLPLKDDTIVVDSESEDISLSGLSLGFYQPTASQRINNDWPTPVYATRLPKRMAKQGVSVNGVVFKHPSETYGPKARNLYGFDHTAMAKTLAGIYPSFEESRQNAIDGEYSAFCRHGGFSELKGEPVVLWRSSAIGFYDPVSNKAWLHPEMQLRPVKNAFKDVTITNAR